MAFNTLDQIRKHHFDIHKYSNQYECNKLLINLLLNRFFKQKSFSQKPKLIQKNTQLKFLSNGNFLMCVIIKLHINSRIIVKPSMSSFNIILLQLILCLTSSLTFFQNVILFDIELPPVYFNKHIECSHSIKILILINH